ncbi:type II/IV secretion system protein [Candidatus Uhrbacteria bacterium]|nr:type II/IV secretion system protein [Candidatus Uhrbacteria bacterium]
MQNKPPSIEDLMPKGNNAASTPAGKSEIDLTAQEKLTKRMAHITEEQIEESTKRMAAQIGVDYINLKGFPVSPEALRLLPKEQAIKLKALPFLFHGEELRIAAVNPQADAVKEIAFQVGDREKAHAAVYLTSEQSFAQGLKLYDTLPMIRAITTDVQIDAQMLADFRARLKSVKDVQPMLAKTNTTDLVAVLLAGAIEIKSSDIHIEAEKDRIVVRYRIDGVLQEVASIESERWKQLINRIKLIAGLKLNIGDKPQDGRFTIAIDNTNVDVRTSALPTAFGESVVMRLLMPSAIALGFEKLGFRAADLKKLEAEIVKPHGMIVTTGPTGSGKTTTLYAILTKLNTEDVKIITLEDPIEYKLKGINQSQIDHTKDYTFSKGLRAILRQDPDVVMVGEIRDKETAETAIQAALTGHLLLSTIHTNDAAGAVPRFLSMGVEPALLAPALRIVMGQRLARRLCDACKTPIELNAETLMRVQNILSTVPPSSGEIIDLAKATWFGPKGCDVCHNSGYKGRVGVYEVLVVTSSVEERIRQGSVSDQDMLAIGQEQGMTTMVQDGLLKAMEGLTSVDEVFRVAAE